MAVTTTVPARSSSPCSAASGPPNSRCCDTGRPLFTDPITGQSVCSCQYDLMGYQRLAGLPGGMPALSMYSNAYPEGFPPYLPALGAEQAPFYPSPVSTWIELILLCALRFWGATVGRGCWMFWTFRKLKSFARQLCWIILTGWWWTRCCSVFALYLPVLCVFSGVLSSHVVIVVVVGGDSVKGLTQTNVTGDTKLSDKSGFGGWWRGMVWLFCCWLCTTSCVAVLVICSLQHGSMMMLLLLLLLYCRQGVSRYDDETRTRPEISLQWRNIPHEDVEHHHPKIIYWTLVPCVFVIGQRTNP